MDGNSGNSGNSGKRPIWLRRFALASVLSTFALIVLGGIVRVTGSGMGCGGEWPLCDGSLIPPLTQADIIEYSHRLVASAIVGPLIVITCVIAWIGYRRVRSLVIPATLAVVLVLAQGGLGGVTVLTELPGHIVAAHLALAQALLGCLIVVLVAAWRPGIAGTAAPLKPATPDGLETRPYAAAYNAGAGQSRPAGRANDRFPRLALISALATYLLLLSGAYVTATPGALAACPDWPLCRGLSLPLDYLPAVHTLHRVVALLVGALILYTLHLGLRAGAPEPGGSRLIRHLSLAGVALFAAQILVGAAAIWTNFPVELRALHIALATAVWAIIAALALVSFGPLTAGRPAGQDTRRPEGLLEEPTDG